MPTERNKCAHYNHEVSEKHFKLIDRYCETGRTFKKRIIMRIPNRRGFRGQGACPPCFQTPVPLPTPKPCHHKLDLHKLQGNQGCMGSNCLRPRPQLSNSIFFFHDYFTKYCSPNGSILSSIFIFLTSERGRVRENIHVTYPFNLTHVFIFILFFRPPVNHFYIF